MQLALEALIYCEALNRDVEQQKTQAITALRKALEQPTIKESLTVEQEPVAWQYKTAEAGIFVSDQLPQDVQVWQEIEWSKPIYTTPPAAQAAPVQEPVVFYRCNGCGHAYEQVHPTSCDCMDAGGFDRVEYFTTPPAAQRPWQGLTDEDVNRESAPITSQMKLAFHAGMYVAQKILKERNND
jgi:hypothetical protein